VLSSTASALAPKGARERPKGALWSKINGWQTVWFVALVCVCALRPGSCAMTGGANSPIGASLRAHKPVPLIRDDL